MVSTVIIFQNCGQGNFTNNSEEQASTESTGLSQEETLAKILTRAMEVAGDLRNAAQANPDVRSRFEQKASELDESRQNILSLIDAGNAVNSNRILAEIDGLVLAISDARSDILGAQLIDLRTYADRRFRDLENNLTNLQGQLNRLRIDLVAFQSQVNERFTAVEANVQALDSRAGVIERTIAAVQSESRSADLALQEALGNLKNYTENEVANLNLMNADLKEDLATQLVRFDSLVSANDQVADLQSRLCTLDSSGNVSIGQTQCAGNSSDSATCCLAIGQVDCGKMFPGEVQGQARAQCSLIISTLKNHEAQLKALHEVDLKQTTLISGLLDSVANLGNQMTIVSAGLSLMQNAVSAISTRLKAIDDDLLIIKFKLARAEAAASLQEMADLQLAWITRRSADLKKEYIDIRIPAALNSFDYETARQNWDFYHDHLALLTSAKETVHLAKAFVNGLQAVNVDVSCTEIVAGKSAESLTDSEILDSVIARQVTEKCISGGRVVAKVRLLNAIKFLRAVSPDFRTVRYMQAQADIAQIVAFGKLISSTSAAERSAFENVDPTSPEVKDTYFGKIERVFKNNYVLNQLRDASGAFPSDPNLFPKNVQDLHLSYSAAEIDQAGTPYLARLKALERDPNTCNCGWKVTGRKSTEPISGSSVNTAKVGERFRYPNDPTPQCPVDDVVAIKGNDGGYYAYQLQYEYIWERLRPLKWFNNNVLKIAQSNADVASGNFAETWYLHDFSVDRGGLPSARLKARYVLTKHRPYGPLYAGRGQCDNFYISAVPIRDQWIARTSTQQTEFLHYLSNLNEPALKNYCEGLWNNGLPQGQTPRVARVVRTVYDRNDGDPVRAQFANALLNRLLSFVGDVTADPGYYNNEHLPFIQSIQGASTGQATTQLTSSYWVLRGDQNATGAVNYGVSNQGVSRVNPFYLGASSHGEALLRKIASTPGPLVVEECQ